MPRFENELLVEFIGSPLAHARIAPIVIDDAMKIDGIAGVFRAADVPGENHFGPIFHDEELLAARSAITSASRSWPSPEKIARCFATGEKRFGSCSIRSRPSCRSTRRSKAVISSGPRAGWRAATPSPRSARAAHVLEGTFRTGGQEHFYLETQAALAIPGEGGQLTVHSSTQNPSEVQSLIAHCLGLNQNQVVCICTRMGGGFGGKESQAAHPALLAALAALKTGRPARIVYARDLDMRVTGKRHPYLCRYQVGFTADGRIDGADP